MLSDPFGHYASGLVYSFVCQQDCGKCYLHNFLETWWKVEELANEELVKCWHMLAIH